MENRAAGEVFEATSKKSNEKVAIKKMQLTPDILQLLPAEISIMKQSTHPCIVSYYGSYLIGKDYIWVSFLLPLLPSFFSFFSNIVMVV